MSRAEEIALGISRNWDRTYRWRADEAGSYDSPFPTLQTLIAAALESYAKEERERCAKIAEAEDDPNYGQSWQMCAKAIAARIREGQ